MTPVEVRPATRRYRSFMADSQRWERFTLRPDDVVISTSAKSGTTWMQTIVGMLLLDRVELGAPISTLCPWLDMMIHREEETFALLEAQRHRRFIKTHTPLDGLPYHPSVTYIAVVRHPLDIALSNRDHGDNIRDEHAQRLRLEASGPVDADVNHGEEPPDDPADFLRWFIDNAEQPGGSGPHGLEDFCQQVRTYWDARHQPNVHLFHYTDMWIDLDTEMRRVAEALGVAIDETRWPDFVQGAGLASMRARADETAPEANLEIWQSARDFFRVGGGRDWASLLAEQDITHFEKRMNELAQDAAPWAVGGRRGEDPAG